MEKVKKERPEKPKNVNVEITITANAISVKENPQIGQIEELHDFVQQLFDENKSKLQEIFNNDVVLKYNKTEKDKIKDPYLYDFAFEAYVHDKVK